MRSFLPWTWALALGTLVARMAWRAGALTTSGAFAAAALGAVAVAAGWSWAVLLVAYFVSASALSRWRAADKRARTGDRVEKPGARDAWQVLANGALFGGAAVAFLRAPVPLWQAAGAAALAASAADTWATEIGVFSRATPRLILRRSRVAAGTSGAVTALGLAASLAASAFIAAIVWLLRWPPSAALAAVLGGVAGSILDSAAGDVLQERRRCPACGVDTERRVHGCGSATVVTGGVAWMTNDTVNALSTVGGTVVGTVAARWMLA